MFCSKCGSKCHEADRFCWSCGSEVTRPGSLAETAQNESAETASPADRRKRTDDHWEKEDDQPQEPNPEPHASSQGLTADDLVFRGDPFIFLRYVFASLRRPDRTKYPDLSDPSVKGETSGGIPRGVLGVCNATIMAGAFLAVVALLIVWTAKTYVVPFLIWADVGIMITLAVYLKQLHRWAYWALIGLHAFHFLLTATRLPAIGEMHLLNADNPVGALSIILPFVVPAWIAIQLLVNRGAFEVAARKKWGSGPAP